MSGVYDFYFSRKFAEQRAGSSGWGETAYRLGITYLEKNGVVPVSAQNFCPEKIKGGRFHNGGCRGLRDFEHALPDMDHVWWFKDSAGRFIFTSQPYVADHDKAHESKAREEMRVRHQAIADRLGLVFRMSAEESWHCPGWTVLLEYRSET